MLQFSSLCNQLFLNCCQPLYFTVSIPVTAWKVSIFGVFLVHIFPHLDWIRRDTISLHIPSKCGKIRTRKTLNTDTFHSVYDILKLIYPWKFGKCFQLIFARKFYYFLFIVITDIANSNEYNCCKQHKKRRKLGKQQTN